VQEGLQVALEVVGGVHRLGLDVRGRRHCTMPTLCRGRNTKKSESIGRWGGAVTNGRESVLRAAAAAAAAAAAGGVGGGLNDGARHSVHLAAAAYIPFDDGGGGGGLGEGARRDFWFK
jgi:hypothetical protein